MPVSSPRPEPGSRPRRLEMFAPTGFPMVQPGQALLPLILKNLQDNDLPLCDNDILVVTQKILSKSENRYVALDSVVRAIGIRAHNVVVGAARDPDPRLTIPKVNQTRAIRSDIIPLHQVAGRKIAANEHSMDCIPGDDVASPSHVPADEGVHRLIDLDAMLTVSQHTSARRIEADNVSLKNVSGCPRPCDLDALRVIAGDHIAGTDGYATYCIAGRTGDSYAVGCIPQVHGAEEVRADKVAQHNVARRGGADDVQSAKVS